MSALTVVRGQPSWVASSRDVQISVTVRGGHMAPVTFFRGTERPVQPYYVSPWQGTGERTGAPVLDVLRGDFFCMPFGADNRRGPEDHPVHGEPAGSPWQLDGLEREGGVTRLSLRMRTKIRPGRIHKRFTLVDGHNVVYVEHELSGYEGPLCFSHHATLAVPGEQQSVLVTTSRLRFGRVAPRRPLTNEGNEYYALAPGKQFSSLRKVPTIWKDLPWADCGSYPSRPGYMDVIAVFPRAGAFPAWTAVAVPSGGYLWFALRDARLLPQTVFWMDNGGRHAAPWSGSNRCLGVEDGRAYFASGLAQSARRNDLNSAGIPTVMKFRPGQVVRIAHIQGAARIPPGFGRVASASFRKGSVRFRSLTRKSVEVPVRWDFLQNDFSGF